MKSNIPKCVREITEYVLDQLRLHSADALELVLRTGMAESGYQYLRQVKGPAIGFFQVEPDTIKDIWDNFAVMRPYGGVLMGMGYDPDRLVISVLGSIALQAAFCRLKYRRDPHNIPSHTDLKAQANYWKRVYNTNIGKGTVGHFMWANGGSSAC